MQVESSQNSSTTTAPLPTVIEIIQFLKRKAKINVESDRAFVSVDPEFIISAIFECCRMLRLCERSPTYQKTLLKFNDTDQESSQNFSFLLKFIIIKEVFISQLKYQDISLTDFIQPEPKKVRTLFGVLMKFSARFDAMLGRFTAKIQNLRGLAEEKQTRLAQFQAIEQRLQKLEDEKAAEKPRFEVLSEISQTLNAEVKELKAKFEELAEVKESLEFSLEETSIRCDSKNRELLNYKEKTKELSSQIVSDDAQLIDSRDRARELFNSLNSELKDWEGKAHKVEGIKAKLEKLIASYEAGCSQVDTYYKKQNAHELSKMQTLEAETRLTRAKQTLEELDQSLLHLVKLEEAERQNFDQYKLSLSQIQEKCDKDLKSQTSQLKNAERALNEVSEDLRTLESTFQSCQQTISRLNEQQDYLYKCLEELHGHAREKFEAYKQTIFRLASAGSQIQIPDL